MQYTLTKQETKALLAHASKDDTRPQLVCVRFDRGHAVTTDGCRIACLDVQSADRDGPAGSVPRAALELALKVASRAKDEIHVTITPEEAPCYEIRVTRDGETLYQAGGTVDPGGPFPDWRQVIPPTDRSDAPAPVIGVNPAYLADLALVSKAIGADTAIEMRAGDAYSPILFVARYASREWRVVIMPVILR